MNHEQLASARVQGMLERHFLEAEEEPAAASLDMFAAVAGASTEAVAAWFAERRRRKDEQAAHSVALEGFSAQVPATPAAARAQKWQHTCMPATRSVGAWRYYFPCCSRARPC